jgi:hypothetical protein
MKIKTNQIVKIKNTEKGLDRAGGFAIINLLISPRSRSYRDRGFVYYGE